MARTNKEIRETIARAVSGISGVNVYAYPPDMITAPAVVVAGLTIVTTTYEGGREITADVLVAVSRRHVHQMEMLDELLDSPGDMSVPDAIESVTDDKGISLSVERIGDYAEIMFGDVAHYGATVIVKVWT